MVDDLYMQFAVLVQFALLSNTFNVLTISKAD